MAMQRQTLEDTDETFRDKYMEIIHFLNLKELKKFNKYKYEDIIYLEILELLPETDSAVAKDKAH